MNKKNIIILFILGAALFLQAAPAFAQENATDSSQVSEQNLMQERLDETGENQQNQIETRKGNTQEEQSTREDQKEEKQNVQQEQRAQLVATHAQKLDQRFKFYYDRLSAIVEKMESRFGKITDKDLTEAQAKLDEAKEMLELAQAKSDESVSSFASIEANDLEIQKEIALSARDMAIEARELFKQVVGLLRESIELAKQAE